MRARPRVGSTGATTFARPTEAAASAALAPTAVASTETAAPRPEAAAVIVAPSKTTAASTARWRWRCRTVKLQIGGHRLAAVLREVERNALSFTEALHARFDQRRNMHKDIGPTAIRQNESKALCLVEPLHSPRFSHSQPQVPAVSR